MKKEQIAGVLEIISNSVTLKSYLTEGEELAIKEAVRYINNPAEFGLVAQEKYDKVTQENEQLKTIIDQFKKMRSGIENLQILQLQQQNEQLKAELKVTEDSLAIAQAENNDNQLQQLREAVKRYVDAIDSRDVLGKVEGGGWKAYEDYKWSLQESIEAFDSLRRRITNQ